MKQRLLITGARAPAALHLARLMHAAGHYVIMADSLRWPVGRVSTACQAYVLLPAARSPQYGTAVLDAVAKHQIDQVIPTCEEVFHLARLWAHGDMPAHLLAPSFELLAQVHNKYSFTQLARSHGLCVPQTDLLCSDQDLAAFDTASDTLVFKPVWSRFATQVQIRPRGVRGAPTPDNPWVAQQFVRGEELCAYAVADAGHLTGLATYQPIYRAGRGAGIAFARDDDPSVRDFVTRFVTATGWHGQVSFDFIRQADGKVFAIECNPRTTSGVHFFGDGLALAESLLSGKPCTPDIKQMLCVKAALSFFGIAQHPVRVWRDLWRTHDVMAWPGDPAPRWQQIASTAELVGVACRHGISLTAASTHDIAWNGD